MYHLCRFGVASGCCKVVCRLRMKSHRATKACGSPRARLARAKPDWLTSPACWRPARDAAVCAALRSMAATMRPPLPRKPA